MEGLEPSTWYRFRVAPTDMHLGTGRGSAPSEPRKTLAHEKQAVEVRVPRSARTGTSPAVTGQVAAAALVVARGMDTTPPPTEEENALAAVLATHSLQASRLRLALVEWDRAFEVRHNQLPSHGERQLSPRRTTLLAQYRGVKRERQRLGEPDDALTVWGPDLRLTSSRRDASGTSSLQNLLQMTSRPGGGAMIEEKRQLAGRLGAEAHTLYVDMLTRRCISLTRTDALSGLSSHLLQGAIQLMALYDEDVDGSLNQSEFAALFAAIADTMAEAAPPAAAEGDVRDWRVAFRRADVGGDGLIDLNELVFHLMRTGELESLCGDRALTGQRQSGGEQPTHHVLLAAEDSSILSDVSERTPYAASASCMTAQRAAQSAAQHALAWCRGPVSPPTTPPHDTRHGGYTRVRRLSTWSASWSRPSPLALRASSWSSWGITGCCSAS